MLPQIVLTALLLCLNFLSIAQIETVKIGKHIWAIQNINATTFQNGDPIPEARTNEEWDDAGKNKKPAWCYYENKTINGTKYQRLYNWYAVNDPRGLAPKGFRIATDNDWENLIHSLGGEEKAAKELVALFKLQPGGYRMNTGEFMYAGNFAFWWTSASSNEINAWCRIVSQYGGKTLKAGNNKKLGLSVRCIKL